MCGFEYKKKREKSIKLKIEDFTVNSLDVNVFSYKINIPRFFYAPIEKGEKIGNAGNRNRRNSKNAKGRQWC